jgi:hypothetical protein
MHVVHGIRLEYDIDTTRRKLGEQGFGLTAMKNLSVGTGLNIAQERLPEVIPPAGLGWRESAERLGEPGDEPKARNLKRL